MNRWLRLARALSGWIEAFYKVRRHSTIGYLSPIDYETTAHLHYVG